MSQYLVILDSCAAMGIFPTLLVASSAIIIGATSIFIIQYYRKHPKSKARKAVEVFNYLEINIVTTVANCDHVVYELRKRSMKHKALGFDCEWVTGSGGRHPVSLLQLSSFDGYCGIFRLNCFPQNTIPNSLQDLLQCEDIYKIGVAPTGDAKYIATDYQSTVRATVDVRYIVEKCGYKGGGLGAMSEDLLNVALNKYWKIRCSDWEVPELTPAQVHYAASDAHAAIQIFVKALENYNKRSFAFWRERSDVWERVDEICWQYCDRNYKAANRNSTQRVEGSKKSRKRGGTGPKHEYRGHIARSKPLYHNCFLQAPDGELLCTCDVDKANWYIKKDLAVLITEDPLTVRLRFEPAARSTGDVGKYYQLRKENQCVVCGSTNSYIRKNVVPREYRKYFPEIMKDHSSHDVLLLCMLCHQRSNMRDQVQRRHLAETCGAPIATDNPKVIEDTTIRKVRMAARALLVHGRKHSLPDARQQQLQAVVLAQFPGCDTVTDTMLEEAAVMQNSTPNEDFTAESHGYRVVLKYLESDGGLLKLEEEWRRHFLISMNPKHMPELWSIHHNRDRLKVKWDENRIDQSHLKAMGVVW